MGGTLNNRYIYSTVSTPMAQGTFRRGDRKTVRTRGTGSHFQLKMIGKWYHFLNNMAAGVCVHGNAETRAGYQVPFTIVWHLIVLREVILLNQKLTLWPASEHWESAHLCFIARVTDICNCAQLVTWVLGIWTQVLMTSEQVLWTISLALPCFTVFICPYLECIKLKFYLK